MNYAYPVSQSESCHDAGERKFMICTLHSLRHSLHALLHAHSRVLASRSRVCFLNAQNVVLAFDFDCDFTAHMNLYCN